MLNFLTGLSTVAVAAFAFVQVYLMHRNEEKRREERLADQTVRIDSAYAALHAEWFRLWTTAQMWEGLDDFHFAALIGVVQPKAIEPNDWGAMTNHLGMLGFPAYQVASVGMAMLAHAGSLAEIYVESVKTYERAMPQDPQKATSYIQQLLPSLNQEGANARMFAKQGCAVIEDALELSPNAGLPRPAKTKAHYHSDFAREIADTMNSKQAVDVAARSAINQLRVEVRK